MVNWPVRQAARTVRQGGVIAYPTETVYGLGCDPLCIEAIQRILIIKQRPVEKGLILLAGCVEQLNDFIEISPLIIQTLTSSAAIPTTWIVPAKPQTPEWLTGGRSTVAVRVSTHPVVKALCECAEGPLISTSANCRGQLPINNLHILRRHLKGVVDTIVPGHLQRNARPSQLIDIQSKKIIRCY